MRESDGPTTAACISRQLWWGHQIPAWYCDECGETVVAKSAPSVCPKCGCTHLTQDPDTLDTWFSSALWPFSTLGWPNMDSEDLKFFYPTNTLVTGYDIIFFWVARMMFSGIENMGEVPFDTVFIHGIVRDSQGRKMSKSLGNGIDPLLVIKDYGADALRFTLINGSTPGNDMRYSDEKVRSSRNFANKLWNAARFVQMNLPENFVPGLPAEDQLDMSDKWVLSCLNQVARDMTDNLDKYELGLAGAKIYDFIWDVYCDWYIEIAKARLNGGDEAQADAARKVLVYVLDKALKLLHPFMPFVTEELYQSLPGSAESIMNQSWPVFDEAHNYPQDGGLCQADRLHQGRAQHPRRDERPSRQKDQHDHRNRRFRRLPQGQRLPGQVRLCHRRDPVRKVRRPHRRHGAGGHPHRPRLHPHDGADRP